MKKSISALKKLFFPSQEVKIWLRILPFAILGVLTLAALAIGNAGWEYTNSSEFCGTSCHTMPPEYSTYLASPHARIRCVECHIGRDAFATQITRKAGDLRHVILNLTGAFEYPIRTVQMRPAREACETCHFPEKFSDDSLREIHKYAQDESNTWTTIYLLMSTGGGISREGLGYGIHWHIENPVYYFAEDDLEQEIPYVRVLNEDGTESEYVNISSNINISNIAEDELIEMDCITCHNRITHSTPLPEDAIGTAISKGLISAELPYIVMESVALLEIDYATKEIGLDTMKDLKDIYEEKYPEIAASFSKEIIESIKALQDIYDQYVFPDQKVSWDTHPNNLGHKNDPGCFRCHDGGHFSEEGEVIRLECNVCHSIPVESSPTDLVTHIELAGGTEPPSHTSIGWINLHGKVIDRTCENCHQSIDPEVQWVELQDTPPDDGSFCGNSICHNSVWDYSAFGEPELQTLLQDQLEAMLLLVEPKYYQLLDIPLDEVALTYKDLVAPRLGAKCSSCHTDDPSGGLVVSSYNDLLRGGKSGPAIVAGEPDNSVLIQVQSSGKHYRVFSEEVLDKFVEWIMVGAPEK